MYHKWARRCLLIEEAYFQSQDKLFVSEKNWQCGRHRLLLLFHKMFNNNINLSGTRRLTKSHKRFTNIFGTRGEVLSKLSAKSPDNLFTILYKVPDRTPQM